MLFSAGASGARRGGGPVEAAKRGVGVGVGPAEAEKRGERGERGVRVAGVGVAAGEAAEPSSAVAGASSRLAPRICCGT